METITYRGRSITEDDITFMRQLIADNPAMSRRSLSAELCKAWDWRQSNGALCDMVARSLMLNLHRAGHIVLPEKRCSPANPLAQRKKPAQVDLSHVDTSPWQADLKALRPLETRLVRRTREEPVFNALIEAHHYLGYTHPVGAHLKYMVSARDRLVACLCFSSAPRHLVPRDRFIGWSRETRLRNIHFVAYNPRYLIMPWIRIPHLASHLLGLMSHRLSSDWQDVYGHPLYFLETFVDKSRYKGTCYRAANWIPMGLTKGRGHRAPTQAVTRPIKEVLGYPLTKRFRERLSQVR